MRKPKIILLILCFAIGILRTAAQADLEMHNEITLSPYYIYSGNQKVGTGSGNDRYDEQGTGYGAMLGYTAVFGWVGFACNAYYQKTQGLEQEILDKYQYEAVTTGDYSSAGILAGIDLDLPITKNDFKSYIYIGLLSGAFIAYLPEQKFGYTSGETANYEKTDNPGYVFKGTLGFKADVTDWLALSLNISSMSEHAVLTRDSTGTLEKTDYYKWYYSYNMASLGITYKF